ncbi:hypothetical protein RAY_280 [Erwinia phage vB_EamM_RAY]|uniref:Uncharacterized protein n=1 Tax=Erwinia phage vB_EamM_RAY TaxID=1815987 RepID=A0A173GEI7_9CAUD|nr:hypothetical protein FDH98_gp238 [Erwinia phage vB_EamM_RAY]ANH52060.1 hypothetical protein RAY_280 [Erwinia phage vB_EamM_RAY]
MTFEKEGDTLHIVRLRTKGWYHMTVTSDPDASMDIVNTNLRQGTFTDPLLQHQYDICKKEMGQDPNPNDIVFHQFVTTPDQTGYQSGHWMIRDHIRHGYSLKCLTNIGDWLSTAAYLYIPDPDDKEGGDRKYKVTDLGKYLDKEELLGHSDHLPMYFLPDEEPGDSYDELIETHRLPQPDKGYSCVAIKNGMSFSLLTYNNSKRVLSEEEELQTTTVPVRADGLLYSSVLELAMAKNAPVWFVLEMLTSETDPNWHFV